MNFSNLPQETQNEINKHQTRMNQSILIGNSQTLLEKAILALEFMMGEDGIDKEGPAYQIGDSIITEYYDNRIGLIDDSDKFEETGSSRGEKYQSGGIFTELNKNFGSK